LFITKYHELFINQPMDTWIDYPQVEKLITTNKRMIHTWISLRDV